MGEFKFSIVKKIGILNDKSSWKKELNLVSWSDREAKYDIRDWDENHEKMSKGITLDIDEIKKLKEVLNSIDFNNEGNQSHQNLSENNTNSDNGLDSLFS